jgi:hypothetical protein
MAIGASEGWLGGSDGRWPTLEDSVGFNLVLGTNLTGDEKDLVAYLRGL